VCARKLGFSLVSCQLTFSSIIWLNLGRSILVVLVISASWIGFLIPPLLTLLTRDFPALLLPSFISGRQNGVITSSVFLQESIVRNWTPRIVHRLTR
jgi:hypothetical protein